MRGEAGGVQVLAARLDASGALDPSFARDGIRTFDFGPCGTATDVAVQADNRVLISGLDGGCYEETSPFRVARLNADGTFDTGFGRQGRRRIVFGFPDARALAMTLDARERIVLAGSAGATESSRRGHDRFALARLRARMVRSTAGSACAAPPPQTSRVVATRSPQSVLSLATEELMLGGGQYDEER